VNGLLGERGLDPRGVRGLLGGSWVREPEAGRTILGGSIDTRTIREGEIFFALPGGRVDGHDFLASAARGGSALAVVEREIPPPLPEGLGVLRVERVRTAMATLARAYRRALPGLRVIAVTGSNGKTTTTRLVHAALTGPLRGSCPDKSHNNDLGLPLTLLGARPGDDYLVCEIGTSGPGEIAPLAAIAEPDIALITSIGRSHLERLGSVSGVAREKSDLIRALPAHGLGVICDDAPALDLALRGFDRCPVLRVGRRADSEVVVTGIEAFEGGVVCRVRGVRVFVPMPGAHNAINAAMAMVVGERLGVSPASASAGIAGAQPPAMRLERRRFGTPRGVVHLVNDAYNANPESMTAAIGMLARGELDPPGWARPPGRRIGVIGEMLEMGPDSPDVHGEIAGLIAAEIEHLDGIVLIGAHAERMAATIDRARAGRVLHAELDSGTDWAGRVVPMLGGDDLVLLKGSRGMRLERLAAALGGTDART
jgi:UDP-N-acetylmuramoyl-tripeptide--D-alanyl-D-alanine ligase